MAQQAVNMTVLTGNFFSNGSIGDGDAMDPRGGQAWLGSIRIPEASVLTARAVNSQGNVYCPRDINAPWWNRPVSPWWQFLLVPLFALFLSFALMLPVRSRQFPVTIIIACIGWAANTVGTIYIFGSCV